MADGNATSAAATWWELRTAKEGTVTQLLVTAFD